MDILHIVRKTIKIFCCEFVDSPYQCYTEHGQHALFYTKLYNILPKQQRYLIWSNQKVCVIQKEYPTAANLGKSQRQHWDIAVLSTPLSNLNNGKPSYDYLQLSAGIEFGLNATKEHLEDDINRLEHKDANVMQGFIVHLYRLSDAKCRFSDRDWSQNSKQILSPADVAELSKGKSVEIYYGMADSTGKHQNGVWSIKNGNMVKIGNGITQPCAAFRALCWGGRLAMEI